MGDDDDIREGTASTKIGRDRTFEVCHLNEENEIEECEIIECADLPLLVGSEQAARIMSDPTAQDVFFKLPRSDWRGQGQGETQLSKALNRVSGDDSLGNGTVFTLADWQMCLEDDTCEVPDDVLLRALGPDKLKVLKRRELQELQELPEEADVEGSVPQPAATVGALSGSADQAPPQLSDDEQREAAERAINQASRFHVHFGAGRLGMGLVVPAISASGIAFAVVQRPKPKWQRLFEKGQALREVAAGSVGMGANGLDISSNDEVVVHNVRLVADAANTEYMPPKSLVFGADSGSLGGVVGRGTSFSCSLGAAMAKVLVPLLSELPEVPREEQPILFCCENDHAAVMKLKAELASRVFVVDCMVDRVCTGREISEDGVHVQAEPWRGSIVVLEPSLSQGRDGAVRVPFCSKVATVPASEAEAEYLSERKLSLVNGMHTVLAFMTLGQQYEQPRPGEEREYILCKYDRMTRRDQRMCEAWRAARAAQLVHKYTSDSLATWHGELDAPLTREECWDVLLDFADYTLLERFAKVDDVVSRVLGGGVANRWLTRLRPTDTWMQERSRRAETAKAVLHAVKQADDEGGESESDESDETRQLLLYALRRDRERAIARGGGIDGPAAIEDHIETAEEAEEVVAAMLSELTLNSRTFCRKEMEITHKRLVKEQRKAGGKRFAPRVQEALGKAFDVEQARLAESVEMQRAGAPMSVWSGVSFDEEPAPAGP